MTFEAALDGRAHWRVTGRTQLGRVKLASGYELRWDLNGPKRDDANFDSLGTQRVSFELVLEGASPFVALLDFAATHGAGGVQEQQARATCSAQMAPFWCGAKIRNIGAKLETHGNF